MVSPWNHSNHYGLQSYKWKIVICYMCDDDWNIDHRRMSSLGGPKLKKRDCKDGGKRRFVSCFVSIQIFFVHFLFQLRKSVFGGHLLIVFFWKLYHTKYSTPFYYVLFTIEQFICFKSSGLWCCWTVFKIELKLWMVKLFITFI